MMHYIAFLRGINVGGHRVKMERLRELFSELGFSNVRTHIQTGNVFFETSETDRLALTSRIEAHLHRELGYEVPTFLRTHDELEKSLALKPFKDVEVTPETRLMILFTDTPLKTDEPLPIASAKNDMKIVALSPGEIFLVIRLINGKWGNMTPFFKKVFGTSPSNTGRFYDTTIKILKAAQGN